MTGAPIVQAAALCGAVAGRRVLHGVDLAVAAGERVALVGPSGSGKTSLARLLLGLNAPVARAGGVVRVEGVDVAALSSGALRKLRAGRIAFVPQNPASGLDPLAKLAAQYSQAARAAGADAGAAAMAAQLASVALPPPGRAYPHQWSRGMQQRFLIALALIGAPKLIVMDEPTSALDPVLAAETMALATRAAADRGAALLIVTHDLGLARTIAERAVVLADGRIVEDGPVDRVLRRPRSAEARRLVADCAWDAAPAC